MDPTLAFLLLPAVSLKPPTTAWTQDPKHFGYALCRVSDLDGDGVDDFVVSAPEARFGEDGHGVVHLFSTRTLERIGTIEGTGYFGTSLAPLPPTPIWPRGALAITSACTGIKVVSLHDLRPRWSAEDECESTALWVRAAALNDVDHDGVADLALVRPHARGGDPRLRCYSGLTGRTVWAALPTQELAGRSKIAATRDRDADGVADLWLATERVHGDGRSVLELELLSGANGSSLANARLESDFVGDLRSIASIGDLDGDAVDDVLLGFGESASGRDLVPGWVRVVSGAQLVRMASFHGRADECEYGTCLAVSKLGPAPRWLVGAHADCFRDDPGSVAVFEHLVESPRARVTGGARADCGFAWGATFLPDRDGDGHEELAISNVRGPCGSDAVGVVTIHDGQTLRLLARIDAP
ncbi:MAG: integrin alpha [Planctomycetes bacterium]|nr:integrin alpha [Planctomycetota bacterium]